MKLSVFTPTHDPKYLMDLWETIKNQPGHWEWIILYNNGAKHVRIKDERVRHLDYFAIKEKSVGRLKKFACSHATGEILVEMDHDDLFSEDAFDSIREAFEDPEIGFAYSDSAEFFDGSWATQVYGNQWGWETYPVTFQGHELRAHRHFVADARSVCQIEYAPNHVRAWRRSVYEELGGHDESLEICDDHDLVCRTYLHTKMKHIPKCIYFYRRLQDSSNTYLQRFQSIRHQNMVNRDKYIRLLITRWADLNGHLKWDFGAAHNKPEGWLGLDKEEGGGFRHDVEEGLPWEDRTVGVIRAIDFLEHVRDPIKLMNEIHRVLVPGGWLISSTPSTDGRGAFCDPTHVSFWNQLSFRYYCDKNFSKYVPAVTARFQDVRVFTNFPDQWCQQNNVPYVHADLLAVKGVTYRPPGLINI